MIIVLVELYLDLSLETFIHALLTLFPHGLTAVCPGLIPLVNFRTNFPSLSEKKDSEHGKIGWIIEPIEN